MYFLQLFRVLDETVLCVCVGVFHEYAWNSVWMMLEIASAQKSYVNRHACNLYKSWSFRILLVSNTGYVYADDNYK